ncbi:MAG: hypothetical protein IJE47_05610, partial [Bacteroidales bacterium]|nr:hypothetical protein [Bacteroidales bacterium]
MNEAFNAFFIIFAIMRMLLLYILLVAFSCQQTTVNGQQTPFLESENLKNSESEKGCEQRAMSHEPFLESENLKTSESEKSCEPRAMSNESFLESENLKTSESEKGCEQRAISNESFLESENLKTSESEKGCEQRAMSHEPFLESENLKNSESEKGCEQRAMSHEPFLESENLKNSESEKSCEPRAMSNEPFLESENLKNSESEKGSEPRAMSYEQRFQNTQSSQLEAQSLKKTVDCCPLTVDYFENQIRLADSLYKNYLPQYNFEEVKAAVMFFDSLRLTTDLLESENLKTSESEKSCEQRAMSNESFLESENLKTSKSEKGCEPRAMSHEQRFQNTQSSQHDAQSLKKTVDCCPLSVDIEYQRARAHYYHAVGLTERDDIVGACEHYFIALEIMESETENLKTSKSG